MSAAALDGPSGADARRWLVAGAVALAAHLALAILAQRRIAPTEAPGAPADAVLVELPPAPPVPAPPAPAPPEPVAETPVELPPPPEAPPLAEELIAPLPEPVLEPSPATPPLPPELVAPPPEPIPEPLVEPPPSPPELAAAPAPRPRVRPRPPPEPAVARAQPAPARAEAPAAAPPQAAAPSAPPRPAETLGAIEMTYQGLLLRHLERHKEYPRAARLRRQEGTAQVRFTMDRAGKVLAASVERSSGYAPLDQATLAMLERAQPLPPIPPEISQARLELVVPVVFALR